MSTRDDDKKKSKKPQENPGSGRPATKFMERPKAGESKEPSSSVDPWAPDETEAEDMGPHSEIPSEGKKGKPGNKQEPQPGWEKEADEEGKPDVDEGDRE